MQISPFYPLLATSSSWKFSKWGLDVQRGFAFKAPLSGSGKIFDAHIPGPTQASSLKISTSDIHLTGVLLLKKKKKIFFGTLSISSVWNTFILLFCELKTDSIKLKTLHYLYCKANIFFFTWSFLPIFIIYAYDIILSY